MTEANKNLHPRNTCLGALSLFIILGDFVADRLLKIYFSANPAPHPLIPGVLEFTKHQNHGLIGNLPVSQWLIIGFTTMVMFVLAYALWRAIKDAKIAQAMALTLIIGGALGNFFDRLTLGYVFDWILLFGTSIINLADISIFAGMFWYLLSVRKSFFGAKETA